MVHSKLAKIIEREEIAKKQKQTLCKGGIIRGNEDLSGVVFPGNREITPDIFFGVESFQSHCNKCVQKDECINTQKQNILEIFQIKKRAAI